MKSSVSPALASFLDNLCTLGVGGNYAVTDLYTIHLLGGEVMYLTSHPLPVVYNGVTYTAAQGCVNRSTIRQALKCEVSQIKLTLYANPMMTLPGSTMPVLVAVQQGLFAEAYVKVDRLFSATASPLDTSMGAVNWFTGNIAEIEELDRAHVTFSVKDPTAYLSSQHPRNQFQTACRHTLFDAGCALASASYLKAGSVLSGASTTMIPVSLSATTYPTVTVAPTAAPTTSESGSRSGVNNPAASYYVVITYTGAGGESAASPEAVQDITGGGAAGTTNKLLQVAPPSQPSGITGWNLYVGLGPGAEQLQGHYTDFTTTILVDYPPAQGGLPPYAATSGWFSGGSVVFTKPGSPLFGVSRCITLQTEVGGVLWFTVLPPLPSAPVVSYDTFEALPGCDKTLSTCSAKYDNLVHLAAQPFIPLPEQSL
jgi:hypothetical protein